MEKGLDLRAEVMKFHNQWYSSNIMALAILGKGQKKKKSLTGCTTEFISLVTVLIKLQKG